MKNAVSQDFRANRGRPHIQLALTMFRAAQALRRRRSILARPLDGIVSALYRSYSLFFIGFDIPVSTQVGPGLTIHHGQALVVNNRAVIGSNVILRQSTTIGSRDRSGAAPVIEDGVNVGSNSVIVGAIRIGKAASIGVGAVVLQDVPAETVAVGNPARLIAKEIHEH